MRKPLKSYTNIFKLRLNLALRREVLHTYPVFAYIEPTLACNLRCPACPTGLRLKLRPTVSIKWSLYQSILDEVGDYLFELYMYNWGEPLLYRDTPRLIRYAADKGIRVILSTNLSLPLSDTDIETLLCSGLSRLIISLDGTSSETYTHYRRGGDFNLVRDNLRKLREAKNRLTLSSPEIVCQFLVFKHNEHEIDTIRRVYREWGADTLIIEPAQMPYAPYSDGFAPSDKISQRQSKSGGHCSWLYGALVLNPNGKVSPCCGSPAESDDFGDYDPQKGWFHVWNNHRFRQARRLVTGNPTPPDGMGTASHYQIQPGELICQRCPMPHRRNEIERVVGRISRELFFTRRPFELLLMGGINTFIIRRFLGENLMKAMLWILLFLLALSPVFAQDTHVVSENARVTLAVGDHQVEVTMFSSESDLSGIVVSIAPIGDAFLGIESFDPQKRYLPNVHIMPRSGSHRQQMVLLQAPRGEGWRFRQIGAVDLNLFIAGILGESTPATLHTDLAEVYSADTPLNLLMPSSPVQTPDEPLMLYSTALSSTVIVTLKSQTDPVTGLPTVIPPDVVVFHTQNLNRSPYTLLDSARTATVPNFAVNDAGIPGDLNNAIEFAASGLPYGFRYNIINAMCEGPFGQIMQQSPQTGVVIDAFTTPIDLTLCAGARGVVNSNALNIRTSPGISFNNVRTTISRNDELLVLGRSSDNAWLKVDFESLEGWASADFVTLNVSRDSLPVIEAPIINFLADAYSVTYGSCITVSWRVLNVTQTQYRGTVVPDSGTVVECPWTSTSYTLSVTTPDAQTIDSTMFIQVLATGY